EAHNEYRLRQLEESYKFTQKERDRESGLHYFEARYLAGAMSRFLSADPKYAHIEAPANDPQALNLYAYVRNNPLQYTDPTGLDQRAEIENAVAVDATQARRERREAQKAWDGLMDYATPASALALGVPNAIGAFIGINTANAPGKKADGSEVK